MTRPCAPNLHDDPEGPIYYAIMHDPEGNEFCVG
jgi:hypothetical protein